MDIHSRAWIECLLVEDNPGDVRLVRETLRDLPLPIRLHVADDGEQALAFLRQRGVYDAVPRPDVVILDLSLPKLRGEDVLAALTGDPVLQAIPVFITLEFAAERALVRRQGLHPTHYLLKPLTARQLLRAFRHGAMRAKVKNTLQAVQGPIPTLMRDSPDRGSVAKD
jgi:CheY-like chemotaxis protein